MKVRKERRRPETMPCGCGISAAEAVDALKNLSSKTGNPVAPSPMTIGRAMLLETTHPESVAGCRL
jgi:hypothetical protein